MAGRLRPFFLSLILCCCTQVLAATEFVSQDETFKELRKLVNKHYPGAKFSASADRVHFEFNIKSDDGGYYGGGNPAPQEGGILGDVSIVSGTYKAPDADRVPYTELAGLCKKLVMAPYSTARDSHLLATLTFPQGTPADFKRNFEKIISEFNAGEPTPPAPVATTRQEPAAAPAATPVVQPATPDASTNSDPLKPQYFPDGPFSAIIPGVPEREISDLRVIGRTMGRYQLKDANGITYELGYANAGGFWLEERVRLIDNPDRLFDDAELALTKAHTGSLKDGPAVFLGYKGRAYETDVSLGEQKTIERRVLFLIDSRLMFASISAPPDLIESAGAKFFASVRVGPPQSTVAIEPFVWKTLTKSRDLAPLLKAEQIVADRTYYSAEVPPLRRLASLPGKVHLIQHTSNETDNTQDKIETWKIGQLVQHGTRRCGWNERITYETHMPVPAVLSFYLNQFRNEGFQICKSTTDGIVAGNDPALPIRQQYVLPAHRGTNIFNVYTRPEPTLFLVTIECKRNGSGSSVSIDWRCGLTPKQAD